MTLSANYNTYNTCLRIISGRGFNLKIEGEITEDGCYPTDVLWIAEKDVFEFRADNPVELLGLIAIYDHLCPAKDTSYWWHVDGADLMDELMRSTFPELG